MVLVHLEEVAVLVVLECLESAVMALHQAQIKMEEALAAADTVVVEAELEAIPELQAVEAVLDMYIHLRLLKIIQAAVF